MACRHGRVLPHALRYIHLNPVKAGIVQAARDYQLSSHRAYLGEENAPWVTTEFGLSLLGTSLELARHAYARFMAQTTYASEEHLLEDTLGEDPRVLGTDRFIADGSHRDIHRLPRRSSS